ncbi:MAG: MinD/ParA family protein [Deltaproteobacteria bacterium]|nr:MinD/ParA family protein [Deltaproteobacteria bacterium]
MNDPRNAPKEVPPSRPLRVFAVTSGKGGVGKTTVSVNLACCAAASGQRVLLLDADLGLANAQLMLGLQPRWHLGDVLQGRVGMEEALEEGPDGLRVLSAGSGVQYLTQLKDAQKQSLLDALTPLQDRFDLVVVDNASGIGDNVVFFSGASHEVLVVASPEPTSLTDAYATIKVLSETGGVTRFHILVNMVGGEARARDVFARLTSVTGRFLRARVSYAGHVPRDGRVHAAVMAQRPLVRLYPDAPAARAFHLLHAHLLASAPPPPDGGIKLMWERTLRETSLGDL